MTSGYRALLSDRATRYLIVTSLLGRAPLGMAALAILLLVQAHDGGFGVAGLAVGAAAICGACVAPVVGSLVDRLGQTRLLVPLAAGNATAWIALLLFVTNDAPAAATVAVAGLVGALRPPVGPCMRVLWPAVIPDGTSAETAFALDAMIEEVVWIAGPLAVGLVSAVSPEASVLMCAFFSLAGTALFAASPASRTWRSHADGRRAGTRALDSHGLRIILVSALLFGYLFGAGEIALPALASSFGSPNAGGVLIGLWCLGSLAAGLLYGARSWHAPLADRYRLCLLLSGVVTLPLCIAGSLAAAVPLAVLAGIAVAPTMTCQYALVSRLAPPGTTTEAFTWVNASLVAGVAMGAACAGLLVEAWSPGVVFGTGAVAVVAAAALLSVVPLRFEAPAVSHEVTQKCHENQDFDARKGLESSFRC